MNNINNIYNLENFMFSKNNLSKYYSIHSNIYNIQEKQEIKEMKKETKYKKDIDKKAKEIEKRKIDKNYSQEINQENKLFWCFYIFLYSFDEYNILTNFFKIEQDLKINSILKIRKNKESLKLHKIKRNLIEDELLNQKNISLKSLNCLALIYKLNIIYIKNRTFVVMNYDKDSDLSDCKNIIEEKDKIISIIFLSKEILEKIFDEYYQIENINKSINALSYYKLQDLLDICKKLNIDIEMKYANTNEGLNGNEDENINEKTNRRKYKSKKSLYTEIYQILTI